MWLIPAKECVFVLTDDISQMGDRIVGEDKGTMGEHGRPVGADSDHNMVVG